MHIYAFGSICRGEIDSDSDVDLLSIVGGTDTRFNPKNYSIYSYKRIREIWIEGNPFAWHLALESKLIFASDEMDFLSDLGDPSPYANCLSDCEKFYSLFLEAKSSLLSDESTTVFDLSTVFLSIRNISTCFSLGTTAKPDFSRHSSSKLDEYSISIPQNAYQVLEQARILCTRGTGNSILAGDRVIALNSLLEIEMWMSKLLDRARHHGGV